MPSGSCFPCSGHSGLIRSSGHQHEVFSQSIATSVAPREFLLYSQVRSAPRYCLSWRLRIFTRIVKSTWFPCAWWPSFVVGCVVGSISLYRMSGGHARQSAQWEDVPFKNPLVGIKRLSFDALLGRSRSLTDPYSHAVILHYRVIEVAYVLIVSIKKVMNSTILGAVWFLAPALRTTTRLQTPLFCAPVCLFCERVRARDHDGPTRVICSGC
jgi:hypothetical protein